MTIQKTGVYTAFGLLIAALALRYWIDADSIESGKIVPSVAPSAAASLRKAAPDFELERSDGSKLKLSSFRGKPVVVHFWAKWCPPCVHEIPEFLAFMRKLEGKPIHALAVSLDATWADAQQIVSEKELPSNVTVVLDPRSVSAEAFGSFQFPETYLIDRDQRIAEKWVGPQDWTGDDIRRAVDAALTN